MRRSQFLSGAKQLDVSKRSRTPSNLKRQDNEKNDKKKVSMRHQGIFLLVVYDVLPQEIYFKISGSWKMLSIALLKKNAIHHKKF